MKVRVETDGGSRGNPGIAGAGSVLFSSDRTVELGVCVEYLGRVTNNEAEYRGLMNGLCLARNAGASHVDVYMDSKLIVNQMNGTYKVKSPAMVKLHAQAVKLAKGFNRVTYTWIARKDNTRADELANAAMDAADIRKKPGIVTCTVFEDRVAALRGKTKQKKKKVAESGGQATTPVPSVTHPPVGRAPSLAPTRTTVHDVPSVASSASRRHRATNSTNPQDETLPGMPDVLRTEKSPVHTRTATSWTGATSVPTRLLLIRHGETEMSVRQQYSGRSNPKLTQRGRQQVRTAAQAVASTLDAEGFHGVSTIDRIISSPLLRARQTADLWIEELPDSCATGYDTNDSLLEMDFGDWDGRSFAQAHADDPELHTRWLRDPYTPAPGGESLVDADTRIWRGVQEIIDGHRESTIALVSHVTPIHCVLRHLFDAPMSFYHRLHVDLASIAVVEVYADGPVSVRAMNAGV